MQQGSLLYEQRFLETYAGPIISDPAIAIVELVANCWDAYATKVSIEWPDYSIGRSFRIEDNGHGMTKEDFEYIWRTIAYDRLKRQGSSIEPPPGVIGSQRSVFGKNGKGRFASFCFSDEYTVRSRKNGQEFVYKVRSSPDAPLILEEVSFTPEGVSGHGTIITGTGSIHKLQFSESSARENIGSRFLANPSFKVEINGKEITFNDIPSYLSEQDIPIEGIGTAKLLLIDTKRTDRSTKQHGIAWWVQGRAVGKCKWSGSDYERVLDGRTSEAKRFTFIVQADFLNQADAVLEDWSGFDDDSSVWKITRERVQDRIRETILQMSSQERGEKKKSVIEKVGPSINALSPVSKERVESFLTEVVDTCPNFGENEIVQLTTILAKLEQSKSRYGLLDLLHTCEPHDYDNLHEILKKWTIGMAKLVLDEIQNRLKIIGELRTKIQVAGVDEVHELQPLFARGLWMFGAAFESIEFTSNKGMTNVIRTIFKDKHGKGSRDRPDFVALPDSSVGLYARSSFDKNFEEDGIEHLVIVDLKTTGLPLGTKEKDQVWKYVKELKTKGYIRKNTRIDGFVLGDVIEAGEDEPTMHGEEVRITPMLYDTILMRAEKRLLNLYQKVQEAPFLQEQQDELKKFTSPIEVVQSGLSNF